MRKTYLISSIFTGLLLLATSFSLHGQTTLIDEDFSTAAATTPPAGWTVQTVTGEAGVDVWHFNNPGRRTPATPITEPFACFDSDKYSDNGQGEEVYLVSPVFDATTEGDIFLEFDHFFKAGYGSSIAIEVFNGTGWSVFYTTSYSTPASERLSFDITSYVQNITNAQIRFKWTGNYSWYWILDNMLVYIDETLTSGVYRLQPNIVLPGVDFGDAEWGDYDNDGDLDLLITGDNDDFNYISKVYRNNGSNSFSEQSSIVLTGMQGASADWGDYDNDGYLDILLLGNIGSNVYATKVYRNDGENSFTEQSDIILPGRSSMKAQWGDYDNDGDLDILLPGSPTLIFRNNGNNDFQEQSEISLPNSSAGAAAWVDYDNDGDLDVYLNQSNKSVIYRNEGNNSFVDTQIEMPGLGGYGTADFGDYDSDGDQDLLLSKYVSTSEYVTTILQNDNGNSFVELTEVALPGVRRGSTSWGDYDNDGDLDIFVSGFSSGNGMISRVYRNDGNNTFNELGDLVLTGLTEGCSMSLADYDNDGDPDLLLTGSTGAYAAPYTYVYRNESENANTPPAIPQNLSATVNGQQIDFIWDKSSDAQNQQDALSYNIKVSSHPSLVDIISPMSDSLNGNRHITAAGNSGTLNSYRLNSSLPTGTYYWSVQALDISFSGSAFAPIESFQITDAQANHLEFNNINTQSATLSWTRGNKDKCAAFMKVDNSDSSLPLLTNGYSYQPNSSFGLGDTDGQGWYCVYTGTGNSINVSGLSGSTKYKVMVLEFDANSGNPIYLNQHNPTNPETFLSGEQYTYQPNIVLPGVDFGESEWGDYDNDGDLDLLITGDNGDFNYISKVFRNNGSNSFTEQSTIVLTGMQGSSADWGDYDNDGDLDIIILGNVGSNVYATKVYRNNGDNSFTEQSDIILPGRSSMDVQWGDYDNDGDLDILLPGSPTLIFRNNGNNDFQEQSEISLPNSVAGTSAWVDYDNDGDLDIYLNQSNKSVIYRNEGNNSFVDTQIEMPGLGGYGTADFGDYDNDGDQDLLLSKYIAAFESVTTILQNDNGNSFVELTEVALPGVTRGSTSWGDYDNDGDLDIFISGFSSGNGMISRVYRNDGNNTFNELADLVLTGLTEGCSMSKADYDNDGDLDLLLTGSTGAYADPFTYVYRNENEIKNTPPTTPSDINAQIVEGKLRIYWNASSDTETPPNGISYNLRVGTSPGGSEIVSPMSMANGKRQLVKNGNTGNKTEVLISLPPSPPDNIYYSVQAIDNGYLASAWSPEQSELNSLVANFSPTEGCQQNEIQFQDKSVSAEFPIVSYSWYFLQDGIVQDSSNQQNPFYAFAEYQGVQQVELRVTNSIGEKATRVKIINIAPAPLTDFTAPAVCQGELTLISNLTDANSTTIVNYDWDFGDGTPNSSAEDPISHNYSPGTYTMALTVTAQNGCQLTKEQEVIVAALPSAALSIDGNTTFCSNDNISLSAAEDMHFTYLWKNNGAEMPDSINSRLYPKASGTYSVFINNTAAANCYAESDAVAVTVNPSPPIVNIVPPIGTVYCMNDEDSELSAVHVDGITYNWSVDGVLATSGTNTFLPQQSGSYTLSVSNAFNCSQASLDTIHNLVIYPIPDVPGITSPDPEFCEGEDFTIQTAYDPTLSYQWMKDGFIITDSTGSSISPTESGSYTVEIIRAGCSNSSLPVEVKIHPIPASPVILADGPLEFCETDSVVLSVPLVQDYSYSWKLNGGLVSTGSNSFAAKFAGSYEVELADSIGCSTASLAPVSVTIIASPPVLSLDKNGPTTICDGDSVELSVTADPDLSYQWMRNGFTMTGMTNAIVQASESGEYQLRSTNLVGCTSMSRPEAVTVVENLAPPLISALSDTVFCDGESVTLSTPQNEDYLFAWKKNGGDLNDHDHLYTAAESGLYRVEISVVDAAECSNASSKEIEVVVLENPLPFIVSAFETELCSGDSTMISTESTAGFTYQWYRNEIPVPGETNAEYYVETEGSYDLRATDEFGCSSNSGNTVSIEVYSKPQKPIISEKDGKTLVCPDEPLSIEIQDYNSNYHYQWLKNGLEIDESGPALSGRLADAEYSVLTWIGNCTAESDRYHITWKPTPEEPEIIAHGPNTWYLACSNDSVGLYRWFYENEMVLEGSDFIYIAGQQLGRYRVEISEDGDCYRSSDVLSIPENIILGTEGLNPFDNLRVYPNPTAGYLNLELENAIMGEITLEIYSASGTQVISRKFHKDTLRFNTNLDLYELTAGSYLLTLKVGEHRSVGVIVVE